MTARCGAFKEAPELTSSSPVSYTHLDVYKRQGTEHYLLFMDMEKQLTRQRFEDDEELKAGVNEWLKSQAADFTMRAFKNS